MMTVFPYLYKFSSMPFGYVCVQMCSAQKLLHLYIYVCIYIYIFVLALYVAWFRNYMQSSTVNKVMKNVDCHKCMHGIAGCHV